MEKLKRAGVIAIPFIAGFLFWAGSAGVAGAAVTGTSTALTANALNTLTSGAQPAVLSLNLATSTNPGEYLNSVTVQIATTTSATPVALSTSSFAWVGLMQDTNHDYLPDGGDTVIATTTVSGIGTSTAISVSGNVTASGIFYVILRTAATSTFTDNGAPEGGSAAQQFVVTISTSTGVVASSTNAILAGATTTAPFIADIHSQTPTTSKIYPTYNSSGGTYSIATDGSGGAGEMGTLNIYSSATATTPIATTTLDQAGHMSYTLGTTYYPSVWFDVDDLAGNATSSRVQLALSNYKPTVTSLGVFTDRIIMNASQPLRGDQANNCGNYLVNGAAPNCGNGPNSPYVEFSGNRVAIKNLTLSGTASFSVNGLIQDTNSDQFPLSFSTSSVAVQTAATPTISAISPGSGAVGASVTITGANFGAATGTVYFSGGFDPSTGPKQPIQASTTAWSGTSITATVPAGAQGGPLQVASSNGMMSAT